MVFILSHTIPTIPLQSNHGTRYSLHFTDETTEARESELGATVCAQMWTGSQVLTLGPGPCPAGAAALQFSQGSRALCLGWLLESSLGVNEPDENHPWPLALERCAELPS